MSHIDEPKESKFCVFSIKRDLRCPPRALNFAQWPQIGLRVLLNEGHGSSDHAVVVTASRAAPHDQHAQRSSKARKRPRGAGAAGRRAQQAPAKGGVSLPIILETPL